MATTHSEDGLRVLSLDGPPLAAAALAAPFFLQQIAHRWAFNEDDKDGREGDDVRVSEMFDIIGGCGLGGLYAILFARLNMTIRQVIEVHNAMQKNLFQAECWAQKDHEQCTRTFDQTLDMMVSHYGIQVDLGDTFFSNDYRKCFIVVMNEVTASPQSMRSLRSYRVRTSPSPGCTIRQALHTTLADLEHLPAVAFDDELFIGTCNCISNPSRLLLKELAIAFPKSDLACFVNLGADYTLPVNNSRMVGQDLMSQFRDLGCFFRLSVRDELHGEGRIKSLVMRYLQEDDNSRIADNIVEAIKRCHRTVNLLRLGNLSGEDGRSEIRRDVSHLRNTGDIKTALEKLRAPYDFRSLHEHGCMEGTREDVFQQIETWSEDIESPNVFWLEGYPGTGKTAISISLKQRLAIIRRLGASCFFRREDASQHSLDALIRSIASQLAENHNFIRDKIVQTVNSDGVNFASTPSNLFEKLLCGPLASACRTFKYCVVIVLDAMDEYGQSDEDQSRLLRLLLPRWTQLPLYCELFIASRSQGVLPLYLNLPTDTVRRLGVGSATSPETASDIRRFLAYSFEDIRKSRATSIPIATPSELDALVDASSGLFIWASTVVEAVRKLRTHVQQVLWDLRQQTTVGKAHSNSLYRLYSTVLKPVLETEGLLVTFCSVIVAARIPLRGNTLSALSNLEVTVIEDIAWRLSPVLNTTDGIRFAHKSFVDFITSEHCPFQLDLHAIELTLGLSCFNIMRSQLRFNIGNIPSSYMLNREVPNLRNSLSEELRYAAQFWGTHLTSVQKHSNAKITSLASSINHIFTHHFLHWLEVVSILGCLREAMAALSAIRMAGFDKAIVDFARDALSFLRLFAWPISHSYPHIYISALPWAPINSIIRQRYIGYVPCTLKIVTNGDENPPAQLAVIRDHGSGWVNSVVFSPDGTRVAGGFRDGTIRFWDAATYLPVGEPLQGHESWIESLAFSPDGSQIVSASYDHTVRMWDLTSYHGIGEPLCGHSDTVLAVAFSPNGSYVVSASRDKTVRIWDTTTQQPIGEPLRGHLDRVMAVAISPDSSHIISGSADTTVRVWDATTRQRVGEPLRGFDDSIRSIAFSPNGSQIAIGSTACIFQKWDAATHQPVGEPVHCQKSWIESVVFSPDSSQVVCGSRDCTISIWDAATHQPVGRPLKSNYHGPIVSVAVSPDGSQILSGSSDETIRIWDNTTTRNPIEKLHGAHRSDVRSVAFSSDGSQVVSGSEDDTIRIWDAATCTPVGEPLIGHSERVWSVAFSPDGSQIVSGSEDCTIRIWNVATHQPIGEPIQGHSGHVWSVAFSPSGFQIVSGSEDCTIRMWDTATRSLIREPLRGHEEDVSVVVFSPDGSKIFSGSHDGTVRIWDAHTGQPVGEPLRGHESSVVSIAFSLDGFYFASGSHEDGIRIWDAAAYTAIGEPLNGHDDWVSSVVFSRDSSHVISGSWDGTVRIWNLATQNLVGEPLQGPNEEVKSLAISPDGSRIVCGSGAGTIWIFALNLSHIVSSSDRLVRFTDQWELGPLERPSFPHIGNTVKPIAFSNSLEVPTSKYRLLDNGWVVNRRNHRLFWIPQHHHDFLPTPGLVEIIGTRGKISFDKSNVRIGTRWTSCIDPTYL